MEKINPKDIEPRFLYRILSGVVGPRPIALVSTTNSNGDVNLAPFSFFNLMSINPPVLVFSPLRRLRTNTTKDTLNNLEECPEVVINIVGYEHVEQMSISGGEYLSSVDEFEKSGFTAKKSTIVKPPYVGESIASFECKVNSIVALGNEGGAGNLVVCEVLMVHLRNGILNEEYQIDVANLDLIGRLGGDYYVGINNESLFSVAKNGSSLGIGWDALPDEIKFNKFLTGNEIGKLASVNEIPIQTKKGLTISSKIDYEEVKLLLKENKVDDAWKLLCK